MTDQQAQEQFHRFIWPHLATVLRTAQFLSRSAAEAEDLAQETMLKAYKAIGTLRDDSDVKAWLMTILRHARIDRLRSPGIASSTLSLDRLEVDLPDESAVEDERWSQPEDLLSRFSDEEVIDALHELPEEIRWTLLLVDVEGMDHREVAEVLAVPVGTIKSRAHRGRAMLREALLPLARDRRLVGEADGE